MLVLAALVLAGCSVMTTSRRAGAGGPDDARARGQAPSGHASTPASATQGAPLDGVEWPAHGCSAEAAAGSFTGANYRPRLLDEVGPNLPFALLMPVDHALVEQVYPSFGAPRSGGRQHEGVDIMAPRGTPVRPAAAGYVTRLSTTDLGGISVTIVGHGGARYFYTHLDAIAVGLADGQYVSTDDVIGYVGNTGNAAHTAPHLHFGVYVGSLGEWCGWQPVDPLPLLVNRTQL